MKTAKIILSLLIVGALAFNATHGWPVIKVFNRQGEQQVDGTRLYRDTFTITNGNGAVLDISQAGYTIMPTGIQAIGIKNTSDSSAVPNVAVKSATATTVTLNVTEYDPTAFLEINILGIGAVKILQTGRSPIRFVRTPTLINLSVIGK